MKTVFILYALWITSVFAADSKPITFADKYNDKIYYVPFHKLKWNLTALDPITVPTQLKQKVADIVIVSPSRNANFNEWIIQRVNADEVATWSPEKAVTAAIALVTSSIKYTKVDSAYYTSNYVDCLLGGYGECNTYADSLIKVFEWMKTKNTKLRNIYITGQEYGGNYLPHAWNTVMMFGNGNVQVSQINITPAEDGSAKKSIEAVAGYHFPIDRFLFLAAFYFGADEYEMSLAYYYQAMNGLIKTIPAGRQSKFKEFILFQQTYLSCQLNDERQYNNFFEQLQKMNPEFQNYKTSGYDKFGLCTKLFEQSKKMTLEKISLSRMSVFDVGGENSAQIATQNMEFQIQDLRKNLFINQVYNLSLNYVNSIRGF